MRKKVLWKLFVCEVIFILLNSQSDKKLKVSLTYFELEPDFPQL